MTFIQLDGIKEIEPVPGYHGRMIHCASMTLAHWHIEADAIAPQHEHFHEQICHVLEGSFELTVGEATRVMGAGDTATIPPHVPHGGRAHTDCRVLDIFHPARDDLRGTGDV